jgi:formiminotetrahydrofolate cyclodeaminase
MVAALSRKKKSLAAHHGPLSQAVEQFQGASQALAEAIDRDAASFESALAARRLPQQTPEEQRMRDDAIQHALAGAVEVPLGVARRAADLFEKLGQLELISSPSMLSDVRVARLMAAAAVQGALENVAINLESVRDTHLADRVRSESQQLVSRVAGSPAIAHR